MHLVSLNSYSDILSNSSSDRSLKGTSWVFSICCVRDYLIIITPFISDFTRFIRLRRYTIKVHLVPFQSQSLFHCYVNAHNSLFLSAPSPLSSPPPPHTHTFSFLWLKFWAEEKLYKVQCSWKQKWYYMLKRKTG